MNSTIVFRAEDDGVLGDAFRGHEIYVRSDDATVRQFSLSTNVAFSFENVIVTYEGECNRSVALIIVQKNRSEEQKPDNLTHKVKIDKDDKIVLRRIHSPMWIASVKQSTSKTLLLPMIITVQLEDGPAD